MGLNAHSLVHLFATVTQVEAGGAPWQMFDSVRAVSIVSMQTDWNLLLWNVKYTGQSFLHLHFGGGAIIPSHIGGGPWLRSIQHSNCLTVQLMHACTEHALISEYAAHFHKELS